MAASAQPFQPPATPARPVVETLHGVTLTDRYRWLENGKDAGGGGAGRGRSTTRRSPASTATRRRSPGLRDELARLIDRDRTRRRSSATAASSSSARRRASRRRSSTRGSTARDVLLFDPMALDPSGKTTIGAVTPNRDGSQAGGRRRTRGLRDPRLPHHRLATGAQQGAPIVGVCGFSWARDERYAYISPRTAESRREAGAAPLLSASARQRPQGRRAADRDDRSEAAAARSTSPRTPTSPCSRTATSGRTRIRIRPVGSHRRAADDLRQRQVPRLRRRSAATASTSAPTTTPRTGS